MKLYKRLRFLACCSKTLGYVDGMKRFWRNDNDDDEKKNDIPVYVSSENKCQAHNSFIFISIRASDSPSMCFYEFSIRSFFSFARFSFFFFEKWKKNGNVPRFKIKNSNDSNIHIHKPCTHIRSHTIYYPLPIYTCSHKIRYIAFFTRFSYHFFFTVDAFFFAALFRSKNSNRYWIKTE